MTCPENSHCVEDNDDVGSCQCHQGYQAFVESGVLMRCMGRFSHYLLYNVLLFVNVCGVHNALETPNEFV